jgi:hypothetical protein
MTRIRLLAALHVATVGTAAALAASLAAGATEPGETTAGIGWWESKCAFSHRLPDDAVLKPGQPGASHSHDKYGNRHTDAFTTNASLRADDDTNCFRGDEEKNRDLPHSERSAMWTPTLYDTNAAGELVPVEPYDVTWGYGAGQREAGTIQPPPDDLRVVFGKPAGGSPFVGDHKVVRWFCGAGATLVTGTPTRAPLCAEQDLRLHLIAQDCSDGRGDSPDHLSHVTYSMRVGDTFVCPPGFDPIPQGELRLRFRSNGGDDVRLSTGSSGGTPTGNINTAHADWINGYDVAEMAELTDECVNADRYCGGANDPVEGH